MSSAEPKLRPKKMRSAGRDLTRADPAPPWGERGPDAEEEPGASTELLRERTAGFVVTDVFSREVSERALPGLKQANAYNYLMSSRLFEIFARVAAGIGADPAFFAAIFWPRSLATKPTNALVSLACSADLKVLQRIWYEISGIG